MTRARRSACLLALALSLPTSARADVTVIYAPPAEPVPLVARPVCPTSAADSPPPAEAAPAALPVAVTAPASEPPPSPSRPSPARPSPPTDSAPAALPPPPAPCPAPVPLVRAIGDGRERRSLVLLDCEGAPDRESLVALSVLARAPGVPLPDASSLAAHAGDPTWVAPSIRRLHPGLLERLRVIADAFPGHAIEIVSGDRPEARRGSRHLHGLALDLRVAGASLDALHALVARFDRTGVGFYPAAGLIHVDVRSRAVHWVDESAPGEPPRPVAVDTAPRGRRIRSGARPAAPAPAPLRPPISAGDEEIDVEDADAIADEITRALGDRWRPPPPPPAR